MIARQKNEHSRKRLLSTVIKSLTKEPQIHYEYWRQEGVRLTLAMLNFLNEEFGMDGEQTGESIHEVTTAK
jgi:hypothetical protein